MGAGKVAIPLSFLILAIIVLVIINIILFSYAMSKGHRAQQAEEEEGEGEEEEKLIPKSAKTAESKPPGAQGGKSSLENIAEEVDPGKKKDLISESPYPGRAKTK